MYAEPADGGVDDPEYAFGGKRSASVGCGWSKTNGWALASGKEVDDAFRTSNMATLRCGVWVKLNRDQCAVLTLYWEMVAPMLLLPSRPFPQQP